MSEPQQNAPNPDVTTAPRRRSSGLMPAFESLSSQRHRNDANAARRASLSDQAPKAGMFGQFFHNTFGRNSK